MTDLNCTSLDKKKETDMGQKTNAVLVHGAWADESSWSKVITDNAMIYKGLLFLMP